MKITLRHNPKKRPGEQPVYVQIYDGKYRYVNTGVSVTSEQWNGEVINHRQADYLNRKIVKAEQNVVQSVDKFFRLHGRDATADELTGLLTKNADTFNAFMEEAIYEDGKITDKTKQSHRRTLALLSEFNPTIMIPQINFDFMRGFDNFLRKKGYNVSTVEKHFRFVAKYINQISYTGREMNGSWRAFRPERPRYSKEALSPLELVKIENTEVSGKYGRSKDIFLFMCYTGLRISDVKNLRFQHLEQTENGWRLSIRKLVKTKFPASVPLWKVFNGKGEGIVNKYLDIARDKKGDYLEPDDLVFGNIVEQNVNRDIKIFEVNKVVTCHLARHTFITHMMASTEMNAHLVQRMTGINKIETLLGYTHLAEAVAEDMIK